jgi:hypothetical protein
VSHNTTEPTARSNGPRLNDRGASVIRTYTSRPIQLERLGLQFGRLCCGDNVPGVKSSGRLPMGAWQPEHGQK